MDLRRQTWNRPLVLFALTGLGNEVFRELLRQGAKVDLLVTREETGPFPYSSIPSIEKLAQEYGVEVAYGAKGEEKAKEIGIKTLICASYHRKIKKDLLSLCELALNMHPGLLPEMGGPCPYFWCIDEGHPYSGLTVHHMTEDLDSGPVVWQKRRELSQDETQSSLREKIDTLSREAISELFNRDLGYGRESTVSPSFYPRVGGSHRELSTQWTKEKAERRFRALSDWPGMTYQGRTIQKLWLSDPSQKGVKVESLELQDGTLYMEYA